MLTSSEWALKKCFEIVKKEATILKELASKETDLLIWFSWWRLPTVPQYFKARSLRKKQVQEYVFRRKEPKKKYRRRSTFGVGVDAEKWVDYLEQYALEIQQLMKLTPSKRRFYEQGLRAATLIRSIS